MNTKLIVCLSACLALQACDSRPVKAVHQTDVTDRQVVELFSYDSCSVYRFYDQANYHYYTNCRGTTERNWEEVCGHTGKDNSVPVYCDRSESIETSK